MELNGVIYEIIYKNEDNGYTIAILDVDDEPITIVGEMPLLGEGENISVQGEPVVHPTYGEQFKVNSYRIVPPTSERGIVRYLSSGIIPGIGEKMAQRLYDHFGDEVIDIMQYSPDRLKEVPGIGKKTLKKIVDAFREEVEMREVILYLQNFDISPGLGIKIYKEYGAETIDKINKNPYRLCDDIHGIGFIMADGIAKNMGISKESQYRIQAGIKFILNKASLEGHTFLPYEDLAERSVELLQLDFENVEYGIKALHLNQEIMLEKVGEVMAVYSISYYLAETGVAKKLVSLSNCDIKSIKKDVIDEINGIEKTTGFEFAEKQKIGIEKSILNGVTVITGGPGTGKTTTVNSIIDILESDGMEVVLAAPTGRAAKRMSEATFREAKTIHRLLEYGFAEDSAGMFFGKDEGAPIEADAVIVDEMSMVDIIIMNSLLKAITPGTRFIMVGDIDQLPSVGAGNVLRDIIDSETVEVVELDEIFRQAKESMIVVNAHKINKGDMPEVNLKDKDFFFLKEGNPEKVNQTVLNLVKTRLPNFNGYDSLRDIQVLTCSRKGDNGVNALNRILQEGLNPFKGRNFERKVRDSIFRVGDKVMQIRNNYNTEWKKIQGGRVIEEGDGVFNGDMGYITDIDNQNSELTVLFDDDREVVYPYSQLDEIVLSYATTVHKSQGSEFPVVVMPIMWAAPMLLTRNLLYTAITRAKEMVVLIGIPQYLKYMIDNNNIAERYSGLDKRLSIINSFRSDSF